MKLHIDNDWLRRKIAEDSEEPEGCPACGAIAGCCSNYPNCPGGARSDAMTTTVKVLIEGNKACEVKVEGDTSPREPVVVKPGQFTTMYIHGEQSVSVKETGDFLS